MPDVVIISRETVKLSSPIDEAYKAGARDQLKVVMAHIERIQSDDIRKHRLLIDLPHKALR